MLVKECTPLQSFHTLRKESQAIKRPDIMCTSQDSLGSIWSKNFIFDKYTVCATSAKIPTYTTEIDILVAILELTFNRNFFLTENDFNGFLDPKNLGKDTKFII